MTISGAIRSSEIYLFLRKIKHKIIKLRNRDSIKISKEELQKILHEKLDVRAGATVLVHCGFGYLNTASTPDEVIDLLLYLVGPSGNVLMPFYPPGLSSDWANSNREFDFNRTSCSTGMLAQKFSARPGVLISKHPTKAIACHGPLAKEITSGHEKSVYPFDKQSPYYKAAILPNSMSIGLGVKNCSMIHCVEDIFEVDKSYLYKPAQHELLIKDKNGSRHIVKTFVHGPSSSLISSTDFFKVIDVRVINLNVRGRAFYSVSNLELIKHAERAFSGGNSRKK